MIWTCAMYNIQITVLRVLKWTTLAKILRKFLFLSDPKDGGLYLNYNFQVKNKTFGKMIDRHARQQRHSLDLMLSIR